MTNCIICQTEENYLLSIQHRVIGFRYSLERDTQLFSVGDRIIFYISRRSLENPGDPVQAFRGKARIAGDRYFSDKELWKPNRGDIFPYRFPIDSIQDTNLVAIRPLIEKLRFITDFSYWALPLQRGYVRLSQEDWAVITSLMSIVQTVEGKGHESERGGDLPI